MVVKGSGPLPSIKDPSEWPHRPAYYCAHPDVHTKDHEPGAALPLNDFVEFETELFVGKMLCRLKPIPPQDYEEPSPSEQAPTNNNSNDGSSSSAKTSSSQEEEDEEEEPPSEQAPNTNDKGAVAKTITALQSHQEYFQKTAPSSHFQFVIQGRFKEVIPLDDLAMGDIYERPFYGVPKGLFMRMYERFMESMYPLTVMDMTSENPRLYTPMVSAQLMRVDLPGNEPDLGQAEILNNLQEDTTLLFDNPTKPIKKPPRAGTQTSASRRRGHLTKPKHAVNYSTNPDHVYTIECCDNTMCFGSYYQFAVGFKIDMAKGMNGQALAFCIFRKSTQQVVCKFLIWHERLLEEMKKAEEKEKKLLIIMTSSSQEEINADDPAQQGIFVDVDKDRLETSDIWKQEQEQQ